MKHRFHKGETIWKPKPWNRCDYCGRFIAFVDFRIGATRAVVTPDSAFTTEEYETICIPCNKKR